MEQDARGSSSVPQSAQPDMKIFLVAVTIGRASRFFNFFKHLLSVFGDTIRNYMVYDRLQAYHNRLSVASNTSGETIDVVVLGGDSGVDQEMDSRAHCS